MVAREKKLDQFGHFDVYWIQTDRQTPRQAKIYSDNQKTVE